MRRAIILCAIALTCVTAYGSTELTLLGPKRYSRTRGTPNTFQESFPARTGTAMLRVNNGTTEGSNRVSSAILWLNGEQILGPADFNQTEAVIELPVSVTDQNTLVVELRSAPGSYLSIQIHESIAADAAAIVGPGGGRVTISDPASELFGFDLNFPSGAVKTPTVVSVASAPPYRSLGSVDDLSPLSPWVELLPSGLSFDQPVQVTFPFGTFAAVQQGQVVPGSLGLFSLSPPSVVPEVLSSSIVAPDALQSTIYHFSFLGLFTAKHSWKTQSHTWKVTPITYYVKITRTNSILTGRAALVRQAFDAWQAQSCNLRFEEASDEQSAQIVITDTFTWYQEGLFALTDYVIFNGQYWVLGATTFPFLSSVDVPVNLDGSDHLRIGLNSDALLGLPKSSEAVDQWFLFTVMHEIGHAIGIAHDTRSGIAVMSSSPILNAAPPFQALQPDDVAAVQSKYGPACANKKSYSTYDPGDGLSSGGDTISANSAQGLAFIASQDATFVRVGVALGAVGSATFKVILYEFNDPGCLPYYTGTSPYCGEGGLGGAYYFATSALSALETWDVVLSGPPSGLTYLVHSGNPLVLKSGSKYAVVAWATDGWGYWCSDITNIFGGQMVAVFSPTTGITYNRQQVPAIDVEAATRN